MREGERRGVERQVGDDNDDDDDEDEERTERTCRKRMEGDGVDRYDTPMTELSTIPNLLHAVYQPG